MRLTGSQVSTLWMNCDHDDDLDIFISEAEDNDLVVIMNNDATTRMLINKEGDIIE